jgi:hypothetical protein
MDLPIAVPVSDGMEYKVPEVYTLEQKQEALVVAEQELDTLLRSSEDFFESREEMDKTLHTLRQHPDQVYTKPFMKKIAAAILRVNACQQDVEWASESVEDTSLTPAQVKAQVKQTYSMGDSYCFMLHGIKGLQLKNASFEKNKKILFDAEQKLKILIDSSIELYETEEDLEQDMDVLIGNLINGIKTLYPNTPIMDDITMAAQHVIKCIVNLHYTADPRIKSDDMNNSVLIKMKSLHYRLDDHTTRMNELEETIDMVDRQLQDMIDRKIKEITTSTKRTHCILKTFHSNFNTFWHSLVEDVQGFRLGMNTTFRNMRSLPRTYFDGTYNILKDDL